MTKSPFKAKSLPAACERFIGDDLQRQEAFEEDLGDYEVALKIYDLRTVAGLSQRELARRIGTTAWVSCQLEDADYQGHSLMMLRRIAAALDKREEIRFVAMKRKARPA